MYRRVFSFGEAVVTVVALACGLTGLYFQYEARQKDRALRDEPKYIRKKLKVPPYPIIHSTGIEFDEALLLIKVEELKDSIKEGVDLSAPEQVRPDTFGAPNSTAECSAPLNLRAARYRQRPLPVLSRQGPVLERSA